MRIASHWNEYTLLDCSGGERLERWGSYVLQRPDPQVIWHTQKEPTLWDSAQAVYHRSNRGGGMWEERETLPQQWTVHYRDLCFAVKCMGFKHTGVFPEQAVNWDVLQQVIRREKQPLSVLNLFAYTGCASIACLSAGAHVTHVDASKGMVAWAKENAQRNQLAQKPARWLVDDCLKFVQREIRRGNTYDIIIMDPPSYGRGPGGEVWKLEQEIHALIQSCAALLSEEPVLMLINSYTTGLSPSVMEYMLGTEVAAKRGGFLSSDEIGLPVQYRKLTLPCGASSVWSSKPL